MQYNSRNNLSYMFKNCLDSVSLIGKIVATEKKDSNDTLSLTNKLSESLHILEDCTGNALTFKTFCDDLEQQIQQIKECIRTGMNEKIEIVFLPYKSSMWDSMESVWRATKQDENCICSVVPIPYFELNGNGIPPTLCYEGDNFPNDVPIVQYSLYDIKKHHPDIIYFHNPYDGYNYVTQVEETYFSSNLSKYTNMLVYIPYFVAGAYSNVKNAEAICLTPGSKNANRVIVQSELHKELFVKLGLEQDKIVALGSPKFDATLRANVKYLKIPKGWGTICKSKKIFLWNTSLDNMLNEKEWFEQTAHIVEAFLGNDDCSLIWRPHPLMEATIKSMRPQYISRYHDLKEKIYSMGNAVIDEESDAYPAISVSDALISDYSSIMLQYSITGKPILSLNYMSSLREKSICIFDFFSNYFLKDGMSVGSFMNMVLCGDDVKKEERLRAMKESTLYTDGCCGKAVHQYVLTEILIDKPYISKKSIKEGDIMNV